MIIVAERKVQKQKKREEEMVYCGNWKCTIYEWVRTKAIPFHRCGKVYGFFRPEIDKWIMKGGQR